MAAPSGSVRWPLACRQWQGARPYQEDSFATLEVDTAEGGEAAALLMILADGMGGAAGGAIASRTAVDAFAREFPESCGSPGARFRECLATATATLREREIAEPQLSGMGTTVVAALYDGRGLEWLSVGDSPMWLYSAGTLERLNADHSMAPVLERLVQRGDLSPDAARRDWRRNMLRSAVTGSPAESVDCASRPCRLAPGDYLLIASDGLETLAEEEIARALGAAGGSVEAAADALDSAVRAAASPGQDNVTFLLLSAGTGAPGDRPAA
ncbi:MAG: protein phosphatase 2C domain-containing protein [Rhodospirillaceae bacterium]|nr:protein phosphatase 2C domain-containing protein [Rhodospirillaceae bacterium]